MRKFIVYVLIASLLGTAVMLFPLYVSTACVSRVSDNEQRSVASFQSSLAHILIIVISSFVPAFVAYVALKRKFTKCY